MRPRIALVVLVACSSEEEPPECEHETGSRIKHALGFVASGHAIAGVSWKEQHNSDQPLNHAALVFPDGTLSPDIRVADRHLGGVGGTTSVVWRGVPPEMFQPRVDCEQEPLFDVVLQRADDATLTIDIAGITSSRAIVFDGTRYQLFWAQGGDKIQHRSLDEDGTLGPVHDVSTHPDNIGACVTAASDGAGATFVRYNEHLYIVDTTTGLKESLWTGMPFMDSRSQTYYFAGKLFIGSADVMIDVATRKVTPMISLGRHAYPTRTKLFTLYNSAVAEWDTNLALVAMHHGAWELGTIETDRLYLTSLVPNEGPASVLAMREGDVEWTKTLAVNSEIVELESCVPQR